MKVFVSSIVDIFVKMCRIVFRLKSNFDSIEKILHKIVAISNEALDLISKCSISTSFLFILINVIPKINFKYFNSNQILHPY